MEKLISFLNNSISPYHAVNSLEQELIKNGFKKVNEKDTWNLTKGGAYYLIKDQTSLIAFKIGNNEDNKRFNIVATHTDSPCFKIKPNGMISSENFSVLNTEVYGGLIQSSWLDRPLGIAGRVVVKDNENFITILKNIDKDALVLLVVDLFLYCKKRIN